MCGVSLYYSTPSRVTCPAPTEASELVRFDDERKMQTNLMRDIRPGMGDIPSHLCQNTLMIITIEQRVLVLALASPRASRR